MIDTDYLVIGAGAAGMAFADSLITESDADVVMVDRRHAPGGHWNDAYPFVRLHQPSAFYGVNSRVLGTDSIDTVGPNAGFYERATAAEICEYFRRVLEERLLASGRVRFFGMCDYRFDQSGDHQFVSRLTGAASTVRVRRKIVDATYLETAVPSTHIPSFGVDPNVRLIPINDLVALSEPGSGYTVIGAGKTGMDACIWLLDSGADAYGQGMHSYEVAWEDNDPDRIVLIVHFQDRDSYMANASRAATDTDYQRQLEYLDGEPEWIDVNYADYVGKPLAGN